MYQNESVDFSLLMIINILLNNFLIAFDEVIIADAC